MRKKVKTLEVPFQKYNVEERQCTTLQKLKIKCTQCTLFSFLFNIVFARASKKYIINNSNKNVSIINNVFNVLMDIFFLIDFLMLYNIFRKDTGLSWEDGIKVLKEFRSVM